MHGGHSNCFENLCHKGFDVKKFRLITPSRPGYGKTQLTGNRTPKQAAALIMELLNQLSITSFVVYGVSAGGLTAIELASNYPSKVSKLILASAISKKWVDKEEKIYKTAKRMFNPRVEKYVWGMVRLFSTIFPKMIAKNFYPQFSNKLSHKLKKDDVDELISAMRNYSSKNGFLNDIDQSIDEEILTTIKCPTLIIHSENDASVPFEHALHSSKMIENSRIVTLNNKWGHLFWIGTDSIEPITTTIDFLNGKALASESNKIID
nr:alpha/beta hydrolase [uncultured Allomuricauda sp.]